MSVEVLFLIAIILLIMEAFVPSLGLLGLGGFITFVSGVILMVNNGQPDFYGLSIQSVIALGGLIFASFAVFGYFVLKSFQKKVETGVEYMIGQTATVKTWKDNNGIITFEGEDWRATSTDTITINDKIVITAYNKMTLTIKKEN